MARAFKFEIGDVVRVKEGDVLTTQVDYCNKVYGEHLTVNFRFWNGNCCCYVLNTGDDNICLICDEARLELEERPPMPPEEVQPECVKESDFIGSVYRINIASWQQKVWIKPSNCSVIIRRTNTKPSSPSPCRQTSH